MYMKKSVRKSRPSLKKKSSKRIPRRRLAIKRAPRYVVNTASTREAYTVPIFDGQPIFLRNLQLADAPFDRSQAVAAAYQQFRMKYIKMTFRPSADTYVPVVGNSIPQLYFQIDKSNSIPLNVDSDTFFSMGCRPVRFDNKNIVRAWKPTVLTADMTANAVVTASQVRTSPWLSTNANSGNPGAAWAPSLVDHLGCAFYVTKINPDDALVYYVDVEVVFEFRRPIWKGGNAQASNAALLTNGEVKPITPTPTTNQTVPLSVPAG